MSADREVLLQCDSLTRNFGSGKGVENLSITLRRGDALGLLGLNGAGKSTTLKLLCGALVPDTGTIKIAGLSLEDHPLAARALIGFLPDQPPLYSDMRVDSYLRFCAKLRRVEKDHIEKQLDYVIDACDLATVSKTRIAKLSKGFCQRVGVAQALIHEPNVLLLDEPSNGLDPQQLQAMRELIAKTASEQSVIFSTHLLAEAQAVCNRIAVLHDGVLIADMPTTGNAQELDQLFTKLVQSAPTRNSQTIAQSEST
ncbi:MAG: ABC transporter ATP-binding protein [Gammaproteobacteria bacterium]|nr:ABC transporter ATP-binding protein [Gammaproteobacteria bacterium]